MARCPKCKARIKFLVYLEHADVLSSALYHGYEAYTNWREEARITKSKAYHCPECGEIVARDEEKAKSIMEAEEQ
jgi:DNA-directed RNA polymerase subunit RPC12/RpoP